MPDDAPVSLSHLRFKAAPESLKFKGHGRGRKKRLCHLDDRDAHARYLKSQIGKIESAFEAEEATRREDSLPSAFGLILNVASEPDHPLAFTSLESAPRGRSTSAITLLNVRREKSEIGIVTKAAIYVPHGKLKELAKKIEAYADPSKDTKNKKGVVTGPKNAALLANIASISVAAFDALWTDPEPAPASDESVWFELWIRRDGGQWEAQFTAEFLRLRIEPPEQKLILPEHIVVVVRTSRAMIESSLDLLNTLSEIRRARPCSVGLTDLTGLEQEEWIDEALSRIHWPADDAPAVCLLDTGVNRAHPLIEPILSDDDMDTVFPDGDRSDTDHHGTPMAGLAAFGDLRTLMLSSATWEQLHRLESVKLIRESTEHKPENYGAFTQQAIALPETKAPHRPRVFCMAVTVRGPNTEGNPSAWSSAIDQSASGTEIEGGIARVILVSAGNVREHDESFAYPGDIETAPIEDPAQAWNAITVGAITDRCTITEDDDEARRSSAVAPVWGLSPFTRTSHDWRPDWPIGPDIVMEGGNLARSHDGDCLHLDSLQPLSTSAAFRLRPLTRFSATSAATAQAARIAAEILHRYPDYRAETIRGLLIHAARWPRELLSRARFDPHRAGSTEPVTRLMRSYGFGVVNEARALASLENETTFVIEGSIQPYKGKWNDPKINECHLIALPWPRDLLRDHPDHGATLRVTLSYFIEPNPGSRTWEKSQKYHYASCLLRFRMKHRDQSEEDFRARLDADQEGSDDTFTDPGWAVGGNLRRKSGSLVQDIWKGTTGQLAEMTHLGVFPAKGWWAYRHFRPGHELHGRHLQSVPYSLIVSLETEADLPIYAEIEQAITRIEATAGIDVDV